MTWARSIRSTGRGCLRSCMARCQPVQRQRGPSMIVALDRSFGKRDLEDDPRDPRGQLLDSADLQSEDTRMC